MADWYVTHDAGGSGVGSKVDPFTLAQAIAKGDYAAYDTVYIKKGTYSVTSAITWTDTLLYIKGYNTTEGDLDEVWGDHADKPIINRSGGAIVDLWTDPSNSGVWNLVFDGNGCTGDAHNANTSVQFNCVAKNADVNGFSSSKGACNLALNNGGDGFGGATVQYGSIARGNTGIGFDRCNGAFCGAYNNGSHGFDSDAAAVVWSNCSSSGNGGQGFNSTRESLAVNCIAEDNTGNGYSGSGSYGVVVINSNAFNNSAAIGSKSISLNLNTDDPALTDPSSDDYSLGNTNLYKLGAYIGIIDAAGTDGIMDLGAIQKTGGTGAAATAPTDVTGQQLENVGGGCLRFSWSDVGDETAYKIYAKEGSTHSWGSGDVIAIVPQNTTEYFFRAIGSTFFNGTDDIYVGVRALASDYTTEDTNTTILNVKPAGIDTYLQQNDIIALGR